MFAIKFREKGEKAWWFSDPKGRGTRLRIHAAQIPSEERAKEIIAKATPDNPDLEFKVVPF